MDFVAIVELVLQTISTAIDVINLYKSRKK
jgi:hypothetical protein